MDRQRRNNGHALSRDLAPRLVPIADCKPLGRATRKHPPQQLRKLAASLDRFGFVLPILIDAEGRVVAGWGLVLAARHLGLTEVPAVTAMDTSDADLRMLRVALNRLSEDSAWDRERLSLEFSDILELGPKIDLEVTGFEMGEIDILLDGDSHDEEDELPPVQNGIAPVSRVGDLWVLGAHRLLCDDAIRPETYDRLLSTDKVDMMFADPPYNVPIDGHVSGLGTVRHADFTMASGELSPAEFEVFLKTALGLAARCSIDGAIHYVCMDWRHQREIVAAGDEVYSELKNLCVWNKSNAGMGATRHNAMPRTRLSRKPANLTLEQEIAHLRDLDLHGLRARWKAMFRRQPPPHLPRHLLFAVLAYRLQADELGDLDPATVRLLSQVAASGVTLEAARLTAEFGRRRTELKPGTILMRDWNGRAHRVMVVDRGFVWSGTTYDSLSKIAFAITGTKWNGPRFFGLRDKISPEIRP